MSVTPEHLLRHSFAWFIDSGTSDVDLIVPIDHRDVWRRFRQLMSESQKTDHRVDLEIILNGDASFHWREFEAPGTRFAYEGKSFCVDGREE
jgi:hypothetical protein